MNIFDLDLHETMPLGDWNIMRVPGGWIYTHVNYNRIEYDTHAGAQNIMDTHSIFVPYSEQAKREILEGVVNG